MSQWRGRVEQEYLETDRRFVEDVLPVGTVDSGAFGLIADATRYVLEERNGEVHIRGEVAALDEISKSLSRSGSSATRDDILQAVQRFAEEWEKLIRYRGKWDDIVAIAREHGEVSSAPTKEPPKQRRWWWRRR
ncbi:MAG: hypothetical protein R6U88_05030 [Candidatus Bipolaricaulota bacterium]